MKNPRLAIWVWALAFLAGGAHGQTGGLSAKAWVDSTTYVIGDRITVHVKLDHPAGVTFQSLLGDSTGGFYVLEKRPLEAHGEGTTTTDLVLARYDSGTAALPPLSFLSSLPGDSASRIVSTPPLEVIIRTVSVDTTKEFQDLKPPLRIPYTLAEIMTAAGILLLACALAFFIYRWWKRRKIPGPVAAPAAPSRPAHLLALEELARVKEQKLWQQGLVKEYYTAVTEVLRRYLERRYGIMALEETTDEIVSSLHAKALDAAALDPLEHILRRADLVKFAKHQPGIPEHEETLTAAYDVVERTKPVPAAGKAETHVGA